MFREPARAALPFRYHPPVSCQCLAPDYKSEFMNSGFAGGVHNIVETTFVIHGGSPPFGLISGIGVLIGWAKFPRAVA